MSSLRPAFALAAMAATAASAAAATASGTPTLDVRVTDDAVEIARHAPLEPGPVKLTLRRAGGGDPRTVAVVELAPGKPEATAPRSDRAVSPTPRASPRSGASWAA